MPGERITLSGPDRLILLPAFLHQELIEDDAFREALGIEVGATITVGDNEARFDRDAFFAAVRALTGERPTEVADEDDTTWSIALRDNEGRAYLSLARGEREFAIRGFFGLSPDRDMRLQQFEVDLDEAGLPPEALPQWRERLEAGPLGDQDLTRYDEALALTPLANMRRLERELGTDTGEIATIAPTAQVYYEHLVGDGEADNVSAYMRDVAAPHVARMLARDAGKGARMALLLASHASMIAESSLAALPEETLLELANWAVRQGDLISRVGMIEVALAALARVPALAAPLQALTESILALKPGDRHGRLALLTSTFVLVEGELSRAGTLAGWQPFRRRLAAFAQAALIERLTFGRMDARHFSTMAWQRGSDAFYAQTLIDLRREPRWLPEGVGPATFHAELVGRVHNAARAHADAIPAGPLRKLLLGKGRGSVAKKLRFPASFAPGPLEGATALEVPAIPPEFDAVIEESLAADRLVPESVTGLVNCRGLFAIDNERVERAVQLIRKTSHRFAADVDAEKRDALIVGLAGVAGTFRSAALASDVKIMLRRVRAESETPMNTIKELTAALYAAAAYEDQEAWGNYIGDWAGEAAYAIEQVEPARILYGWLELLCASEPALRKAVGSSLAALRIVMGN